MRYRIKITTFKTGRKEFRSQKKVLFGWANLSYNGEADSLCDYSTDTREDALRRIDKNYDGNVTKQSIEFEYHERG